ncbi:fimbria/pilus outer membrane usher protein [Pseudomonas sp. Au-Pse12]|uniref:fimbria/pilus outer membrane usher protein n=1 Tax=Pseudomonas sp. Au-Pse12 TaxID=2906459 RepID=UPI001E30C45E|nr:fimbria/pilus outer membrane usher protein [Pseudomonas sp. Au-Pse12]MCE4057179.1 fimbrial biogenesis outer membrane usher protein [Pseudomonas sp. Au-Pse12]
MCVGFRTIANGFAGSLLLVTLKSAEAAAAQFDTGFVADFAGDAALKSDLEAMLHEQDVGPGRYLVGINLNRDYFGQREVSFVAGDAALKACLPQALLSEMGVKLPPLQTPGIDEQCLDLPALVEGATVRFDSRQLKLDISVPQISMDRDARGYVAAEEWDSGVNAGFLNYQFSGSQSKNPQRSAANYNLYLNGGLNLGEWRLRSSSSYRKDGTWERAATYVQRDLPGTLGSLTLGESVTPGDTFQSVPFRGVQLASDTQMLPDSLQGYAPVIRGVAQTQARVEVRQHGYSLYSTFVSPGPFEIRDLNAASGSGDLEVIITEADGTERRFIQPYATLGNLLRDGTWRYSVSAGQYHEPNVQIDQPTFTQASLAYGLPRDYTLSLGGLLGEGYRAYQVGVGKGLGSFGALSLDVTQAATDTRRESVSGQSYGLRYGKAFATGTNLRFAGYRYSTPGYRDFSEAVSQSTWSSDIGEYSAYRRVSRRSRLEANLSQAFADSTSLYLNLSQQDYWNSSHQQRQLQFGISGQVQRVNLSLYASKSLSASDNEGVQLGLSLSFPLGRQNASVSLERNADGSQDQRLGLSGLAGDYNNLNYNLDMLRSERSANTGSASVGYRAPWANINAGLSSSSAYKSANVGISGSVLAHAGGVQLGQSLGETMALVEVKDTPNVGVNNAPGTFTNAQGYSLVPYVQPYRRNRISLDTSKLDANTDIDSGVSTVTPRRGAVVLARFKARHTEKVLASVTLPGGAVVPFGAAVLEAGQKVNAVGPAGQVLLSVGEGRDFRLVWGNGPDQQCRFTLDLEQAREQEGFKVADVRCTVPAR